MKNTRLPLRAHGFTLIELVVTMAIAAVLMMVAVPSFQGFQRNSELTSVTNSLVASIYAARGEAMKTGLNAFVMPTDSAGDWTQGWAVFVDNNLNNTFDSASDTVVQAQPALASYLTVQGTGIANGSGAYIMFNSSGYSKEKTGGFGALTFSIARSDVSAGAASEQTRRIVIASTGRLRTCKPKSSTDADCLASATN